MSRKSKGKLNRSLAASHQRSWLWGRHAVTETLKAGLWSIVELLIDEDLSAAVTEEIYELVATKNLQPERVSAERLTELCRAEDHQGYIARMSEFPCRTLQELSVTLSELATVTATATATNAAVDAEPANGLFPLFVILDSIQDAHNFGAILRCCDSMKVNGVIIGERSQVSVTPHVARASVGAVNHLTIYKVGHLPDAVRELKSNSVRILAASEKATTSLWQTNARCATAVIIGSEAFGISRELQAECDEQVSIPMMGGVESLNAAVAAGIVLYECRRQQLSVR